jgi:MFS family permease
LEEDGEGSATTRPLAAAALLSGASWGLAWATLAPYLRGLGFSGTEYGALGAVAVLTGALASLAGGVLSDSWGARRTAVLGLLLSGVAWALMASQRYALIASGFALNGVASGLGMTAMQALASRTGSESSLHYTLSYYSAASTLGGAAGSFAGWIPVWASHALGVSLREAYRWALLAGGALSASAALPLSRAVEKPVAGPRTPGLGSIIREALGLGGGFYRIALIEGVIGFGAAMSIHNIDYYFTAKYGVSSGGLGTVLGAQQLIMAVLMAALPRISDRAGGELRLYLTLTSSSVPLLVAMTFVDSFRVAAAIYLVRSILMNAANPLLSAYTFRLVPPERRGLASAFLNLAWTVPAGAGRAVGGYLLDLNLELPLRATAAIYTAALAALAKTAPRLGAAVKPAPRRARRMGKAAVAASAT